ncbi:MAG: hypothetical protein ACRDHI_03950 [Actinomycetota bacterium]
MTTTDRRRPQRVTLELQARARDHALARRLDELERVVARVHSRIDGAMVTVVPQLPSPDGAASPHP